MISDTKHNRYKTNSCMIEVQTCLCVLPLHFSSLEKLMSFVCLGLLNTTPPPPQNGKQDYFLAASQLKMVSFIKKIS